MGGIITGLLATVAMVPAMVGTLEAAEHSLSLALCGGGTLTIQLPAGRSPTPAPQPCCVNKGCETGKKRKRFDRAQ